MDVTVARVLMWQFLVGMVLALVCWAAFGRVAAYSALLGGLIAVLPNAFLGLRLILPRRDPSAQGLLRAAWVGEIGKLALTVLMFTLVFTLVKPLMAAALFVVFIATQMVTLSGFLMRSEQIKDTEHSNGS